ncbi:MAG: hypothetical protein KZQ66_01860 [Candidatus Thiodiazotropha sp. (ex Lucinoma aequizonata)]|nr:hypothetical protein [Candidatus Thiodiazotropha sp. (ex Lucinoma aequizonata)]MCU7894889.1 hypothetical protein [Candidatus Thiodiazotropha sp. (ex Lucinoma aequizonata)]MCU7900275.1 hypothetical protein [Candidatus Thiodiazotropha sp. (ex Lucinoma aequizonata)]MCU7900910.1 hypothetical protein [Candidatus Thiodiazotropha sp. (ex Lucinoma aequizonata)]MCU7909917.1 hypothetical protein [Candidatus Thiodiazotropha sp. (ex Lucinoma aequizonata)]
MKWLFCILLLANLGLFLLIYPQGSQVNDAHKVLSDMGELTLFHETVEPSADVSDSEPITLSVGEKQVEDLSDETVNNKLENGEAVIEPTSSLASEPLTPPQQVPSSEQVDKEPPPVVLAETPEPRSILATPICKTVGFLESRSDADIVSVRLRALGLKPDLESETRNEQAGVWVLIPPQASRHKAIEIANRLEKDGIADLWRFTSGELVHAISLGLFRDGERAEARRKEITEMGYEAIIKPRYRQKTNYWLHYQGEQLSAITKKSWDALLADFPNLELKEVACQ